MSGGIDGALVAAIACDTLGAQNVSEVRMPSEYSSEHSLADAARSAALTGMNLHRTHHGHGAGLPPATSTSLVSAAENLQARVRGAILMGISNSEGHLVLATGNKSELARRYSTIYGDAVGGFAPIRTFPKTLVWEMRDGATTQRRAGRPDSSRPTVSRSPPPPSWRPGQTDTDSLPDYHETDRVLEAYVGADMGATELPGGQLRPALVSRTSTSLTLRVETSSVPAGHQDHLPRLRP